MDLRVLVLTGDAGLADLLRTQAENLGCQCTTVDAYDQAGASLGWADAAVIDLVGDGLDTLSRLRVEAPALRVLAVAPSPEVGAQATEAGAEQVLLEPFTISDVTDGLRALAPTPEPSVIDLRGDAGATAPADDAPWWATR
jgi:DNA-binding response OmpR family regulator